MSENKTNSSPNKLSEELPRLIEERKRYLRQKYGENVPYWEISLAELEEMDQEQQEALLEKSLRDYPEEGKQFLSDQADLRDMAKEAALATSEWPAFPKERLYENPFAEGAREAWEFYRGVMEEDEVKGWNLLKEHERWYSEQIKAAEKDREEWKSHREMRRRIYLAKIQYFVKRRALRRFTRKYMMFLTVPGELTQKELNELSDVLPITGSDAPEYAEGAYHVLKESPSISSFTKLAAQMGEGGNSKVDTIKRGIGYNDLSREDKTFGKFKKLLFEKVRLMKHGEIT